MDSNEKREKRLVVNEMRMLRWMCGGVQNKENIGDGYRYGSIVWSDKTPLEEKETLMSNCTVRQPGQRCSGYDVPNYYDGCNFGS